MFATILISRFRLQAALRLRREWRRRPLALVDDCDGEDAVLEVTTAAATAGVTPGLPSVQALARCPRLTLLPRTADEERVARDILLEVACSCSPQVEATFEGCCTLDLRGLKIENLSHWAASPVNRLAAHDLDARVGVAPNPDLAGLAARRASSVLVVAEPGAFLASIPVAELDPPPGLAAILHDWGIRTLGQFGALAHGEVAVRLGPEAAGFWQRATGRTQRLLRVVRPPDEFVEAFDFEHGIETLEPLCFILRRFFDHLAPRLRAAHRVAGKMTLELPLENGTAHQREFILPSPTTEVDVLFRVLQTHLDVLQLDQRPVGVRLRIDPAPPERRQLRLFESPLRDPNRFGETLARLAALVGPDAVGVPQHEDSRRPDAFHLAEPRFHGSDDGTPANVTQASCLRVPQASRLR